MAGIILMDLELNAVIWTQLRVISLNGDHTIAPELTEAVPIKGVFATAQAEDQETQIEVAAHQKAPLRPKEGITGSPLISSCWV